MSDTDMLYMASLEKRLEEVEAERDGLKAWIANLKIKTSKQPKLTDDKTADQIKSNMLKLMSKGMSIPMEDKRYVKLNMYERHSSERCICCGDIIPEGRQICCKCEKEANE